MSDETKTGTPSAAEGQDKSAQDKSFTEAEVQTRIAEALKEGETKAYRHWQAINDKVVAAERTKNAGLAKELDELKGKQFESLSPDEQTKAMLRDIHQAVNKPREDTQGDTQKKSTSDDTQGGGDDVVAAVRTSIGEALKEAGLDPAKVDWAEDTSGPEALKRFLKSVVTQVKPAADKKPSEEETEVNRVDTSKGGGHVVDLRTIDPMALVRAGLDKPPK